ncbi:MAG: hypothetical protein JRJ84_13215, partial [Deltaproteobacteria bacterium]|nr:hypothetical protein [Deltaproteobacteria bacterium]
MAAYAAVLAGITYVAQTEDPVGGVRNVEVIVKDPSGGWSDPVAGTLTVVAVNDVPVVDLDIGSGGSDFATGFLEGQLPERLYYGAISDLDDTQLVGVTVVITDVQDVGDEVLAADTGNTPISSDWDASSATLTLTGSADLVDYQSVLGSLTYAHPSEDPTEGDRHVTVTVDDGQDTATATATVTVAAVNDEPVADLNGSGDGRDYLTQFTEGAGPISAFADEAAVVDPDAASLDWMTMYITQTIDTSEEGLSWDLGGTAVSATGDAQSVSFDGPASVADFTAVLDSIAYDHTGDPSASLVRWVKVQVSDGVDTGPLSTAVITNASN